MTGNNRQLVIMLTLNSYIDEVDQDVRNNLKLQQQNWLKGKSIVLLYNERFLDVDKSIASSVPKAEVQNFLTLDADNTQSIRQTVVEQSRFYSVKLNTAWQSETRFELKNSLFDTRDDWFQPDRTMNEDSSLTLFEFEEMKTQQAQESITDALIIQQAIVIERDLNLRVYRRLGPSIYSLAAYIGGLIVIFWILGYLLVSCLTINAYEDHMVQAIYPTKDILKSRLKHFSDQFPISEQEQFKDILEAGPVIEAEDLNDPELDVSRHGFFRCFCRCLSLQGCLCRCFKRCCRAMWCCKVCKQSRTERMFEVGRQFYKNEVSVQRLV